MKVAVIGAGSWGTAVAALIADRTDTTLWARRAELADAINGRHENPEYLEGFRLPPSLRATSHLEDAIDGADAIVVGVPSHGFRAVLGATDGISPDTPIVSLAKGIEQGTLKRMTEVVVEVLGSNPDVVGVLTGPNLAREIMAAQPAASVIAMPDEPTARLLQDLFMGPTLRVYTNRDVVGCEAAGALKNVMAIAAGVADGLGYGHNSLAALVTRALAELTRLGVAMGGNPLTFAGLAGMGDLIATCMSSQSRNHRVGYGLGQGRTLDQITTEMNMVAEGVKTTASVLELARLHGIEMPIAEQVGAVLYDAMPPSQMLLNLMMREAKPELHGIDHPSG